MPDEPALADYVWYPDGFEVSAVAAKATAVALTLTTFLSAFNWLAFFSDDSHVMLKVFVGLFDLFALVMWWRAVRQVGRALKFGRSRVEFGTFPFRVPGPVTLRWHPFGRIDRLNKGTFTLRCIEEWMERSGSGEDRTTVLVHEEIWRARALIEQSRRFQRTDAVELRFQIPDDAPVTCLSADKPVFWELEVALDLPGLDFNQTYLVPVYY